ncbi:cytochrome P450 [Acephala macrosclerotiorum]|nr:cytochrome P450 [Acephala macrosclerotiorum]
MAVHTSSIVMLLSTSPFVVYCASLVVYHLYFSPISKFSGSKLTVATLWYEFYYEAIKREQFTFQIQEWHKQYGPIIRINPYEIHIDDPNFYHLVFSNSGIRGKRAFCIGRFGNPNTALGAVAHDVHRMCRQALNSFFSKASIVRLMLVISSMIEKHCSQIDGVRGMKVNTQILQAMEGKEPTSDLSEDELLQHTQSSKRSGMIPTFSPKEKSTDHLGQTGQDLIGAGGESTGAALAITTFYLLSTPRALERLRRELEDAMPDKYGQWELSVAEELSYLVSSSSCY